MFQNSKKQPTVNVQLAEPVSLFQSDEFETETTYWKKIKEPKNLLENYRYENGELALLYTNEVWVPKIFDDYAS